MVKNSKKIKQSKIVSDDMLQIRNLFILLISVVVVCVGIFFLTEKMIDKESTDTQSNEEVEINYDIATIGTMFSRPEKEYYVLIYSNEESGDKLNNILDTYRSSDNYIKTYYVDLDDKMNESAKGKDTKKDPKNSKEVSVNEPTLYNIKDGKVTKCYIGTDNIIDILK